MSLLSMLLCMTMLIGTTFAWFTDTVTSAGNKIESGTLKVDLELLGDDGWESIKESKKALFDYKNWEPGYTEVKVLKVENEGTLALKWMAQFISEKQLSALAGVIDVYVCPSTEEIAYPANRDLTGYTKVGTVEDFVNTIETTTTGELKAKGQDGSVAYLGIALKMQESAGNEYQGMDLGGTFDIVVRATQLTSEDDSFGNDYDEAATYPATTGEELKAAIEEGSNIVLEADIKLYDEPLVIANNTTINTNGYTLSGIATNDSSSAMITVKSGATLTLTGNGTITFGATTPDTNWGGEGQPAFPGYANNTIKCEGKLVVDGPTIENVTEAGGASYAIDCYQGSDLVVDSGKIDGVGKCAIRMFCNSNTLATNVTINGGTITGKRAIWVQLPGSNINNVRPVNLTIKGGELICTNTDADVCLYSYSYGDSFANTNITITGGTFTGDVCFGGGNAKSTQENVVITGGTFKGTLGRYLEGDVWEDIAKPQ